MREIRKSGSEGGAGQNNVPFLPLSLLKAKSIFQSLAGDNWGSVCIFSFYTDEFCKNRLLK